ncbi:MAG: hypothetical protein ACREGI_04300, partial [Candidatus Levyibacteriota bacterium]
LTTKSFSTELLNLGLLNLGFGRVRIPQERVRIIATPEEYYREPISGPIGSAGIFRWEPENPTDMHIYVIGNPDTNTIDPTAVRRLVHEGVHWHSHEKTHAPQSIGGINATNGYEIVTRTTGLSEIISLTRYFSGLNEAATERFTGMIFQQEKVRRRIQDVSSFTLRDRITRPFAETANLLSSLSEDNAYTRYIRIMDSIVQRLATHTQKSPDDLWKLITQGLFDRKKTTEIFSLIKSVYGDQGLIMLSLLGVQFPTENPLLEADRSRVVARTEAIASFFSEEIRDDSGAQNEMFEIALETVPLKSKFEVQRMHHIVQQTFLNPPSRRYGSR